MRVKSTDEVILSNLENTYNEAFDNVKDGIRNEQPVLAREAAVKLIRAARKLFDIPVDAHHPCFEYVDRLIDEKYREVQKRDDHLSTMQRQ